MGRGYKAEVNAIMHARYQGLQVLQAAIEDQRKADLAVAAAVEFARSGGHSWAAIATVFGISRQAAQKRFGSSGVKLPA